MVKDDKRRRGLRERRRGRRKGRETSMWSCEMMCGEGGDWGGWSMEEQG